MTFSVAPLPPKFHPYLLGSPSCIDSPAGLLDSLAGLASFPSGIDPHQVDLSFRSGGELWRIRTFPQGESTDEDFSFFQLAPLWREKNLHIYEPLLAKKIDAFIRKESLSHLFVLPPRFLYQRGSTTYLISKIISPGSPARTPSREQVLALAEMTTLGLPLADNLNLDDGGRVILSNCESPSREIENRLSRIPTKVLVYSVRLQKALSQTARLKAHSPAYRREIELIEKKHILKRTTQIITQIACSLLVIYSIERYLNPHLTAKDLLSKSFSFESISLKDLSFSKVATFLKELTQNRFTSSAVSYPFTIKRLPTLSDLVTGVAFPLFVSFLLGRYVTKRPLSTSLLLMSVQHIFSPLSFALYSVKPLTVFAQTMYSFRT